MGNSNSELNQTDSLNESGECKNEEWNKKFKEIKTLHDKSYHFIESGITEEELDHKEEALELYKQGITIIDKVLNINVECPEHIDSSWEEACNMIQKLKRTRAETLKRICALQPSSQDVKTNIETATSQTTQEPSPPSYYEATSNSSTATPTENAQPQTYSELAAALDNLQVENSDKEKQVSFIYSQQNVRIYFISPDGTVAALPDLLVLNIFSLLEEKMDESSPSAFIQISEWIYPLIPGVSPCYKSESGALIFPDINALQPGAAIGIVLPSEEELSLLLSLLDDIIHGVVTSEPLQYKTVPRQPIRKRRAVSTTISNGLVNGAWYMKEGIVKGAQAAGSLINYGTPKLINHLTPAHEPTEVSPRIQRGFTTAKNVTGSALSVTGFVAGKVGDATVALGHYLAPHIQKQGTKLLSSGFKMDEDAAHERMDGVLTVAAGAVEGFATVYSGLEESASILGKNITENTVKVVEHKYGPEVGLITSDSIYTANNMFSISNSLKLFKPTSFAKLTVKNTGKGFLDEFKLAHYHVGPNGDTAGHLNLPDLSAFEQHLQTNK